jgi:predicted alpha/beta superfamily hydrolase
LVVIWARFFWIFFLSCLGMVSHSQRQVNFVVSGASSLPAGDSLFIAGSFNGWDPHDQNYCLAKNSDGDYFCVARIDTGAYEFKLTRGAWNKVECTVSGRDIQNRTARIVSDTTIHITVSDWKDHFIMEPKKSTASNNVHLIDSAFFIPQLNRHRRIWIYLPPGYERAKRRYPVLYMQDGQNVFDEATSFSGEWGVDETLDSISRHRKEIIVVAVDHGGEKRINEYAPHDMEKYGQGEGDQYLDFLVHTLKPFIDTRYRTQRSKDNTFIAGSSMGGLISMYALLKYPKVFGGGGIFSPAFWVTPQIFDDITRLGKSVRARIYFYCGALEGASMQGDMERAVEQMRRVSKSAISSVVRPDGKHSEMMWREEFPHFYLWLTSGL